MFSRSTFRASRSVQSRAAFRRAARRNYATENATPNNSSGVGPGVVGGLMGAGIAFSAVYGWYHFSGAKTAVNTAQQAKSYVDYGSEQLKKTLQEATPDSAEGVISKLKEVSISYAGWIPGGRQYVDSAFKDLEEVQKKHGDEVNEIVKATYEEIKAVSQKKGSSLETANDVWSILSRRFQELASLAGDSAQQILSNHPEVEKKLGGSYQQLKDLGDRVGPDAKKKIDETWSEVSQIAKSGFSADSVDKIRKLIQEKVEEVKKLGDQAWNKAWDEQIKPALDKNPQVKELVEQNLDTLKNGNISEAISKVTSAVSSGNTKDLEAYVKNAANKAEQFSSGSISKWLNMVPGGSEILPQLMKLKEAAEKKGPEAEQLTKDTLSELQQVLQKRSKQAEDLAKDVKDSN